MKILKYIGLCMACMCCHDFTWEVIRIGNVSFEVPKNWQHIEGYKGIDSNVIAFLIKNSKDTIFVELGKYNNPFDEENDVINDTVMYEMIKRANPETNSILAIDTIYDYKQGLFLKNYYYYDTIDGKLAKLMLPKKEKEGRIGIYFKQIDSNKNSFSIESTNNLSQKDKEYLIKVFYTIEFKK